MLEVGVVLQLPQLVGFSLTVQAKAACVSALVAGLGEGFVEDSSCTRWQLHPAGSLLELCKLLKRSLRCLSWRKQIILLRITSFGRYNLSFSKLFCYASQLPRLSLQDLLADSVALRHAG